MPRAQKNRSRSCGFTLIELLVVIAIILVLAGLLLPAIKRVGEQTRSANCQSNMRQLLIGIHLYEQENGILPAINSAGNTSGKLITVLKDHVDNFKVFHCPAHQGRSGEESNAVDGQRTCYKYNDNGDPAFFQGKPLDNPKIFTTTLVLLIDSMDFAPRHYGGANLGFADGHVEWVRKDKYNGPDPMKSSNVEWYNWGKK